MVNYWLDRIARKQAVARINALLRRFIGKPTATLDVLKKQMRQEIVRFFAHHPEVVRCFGEYRIDYQFHIEDRGGSIVNVTFEVKG